MGTTTTRLGLFKPDPDEVAHYIDHMNENWDKLDDFVTFERRNTFPGSPITSKSVLRSDQDDQPYFWNGSSWIMIERNRPFSSAIHDATITSASTSFIPGSTEVNTTITARGNGVIYITVAGELDQSAAGNTYLSFELRETNAAGALIWAADDRRGLEMQDTLSMQASFRIRKDGLTPGQVYFARCMVRVSANTGTWYRRRLILEHG